MADLSRYVVEVGCVDWGRRKAPAPSFPEPWSVSVVKWTGRSMQHLCQTRNYKTLPETLRAAAAALLEIAAEVEDRRGQAA